MKNKIIYNVFITLFLCVCLLPLAAMTIVGESEPAANELPISRPELIEPGGGLNTEYTSQLTEYIANRFAFRRELVTAWSKVNALFGSSAQEQVILGRDGWLFFSETLEDYMGLGLSEGLLQNAANNLALMQEYAESRGQSFVFTIAPNKNSLYPQYMPGRCAQSRESSNAARLAALLGERGVNYVDLFSAFAGKEVLYYSGDSHWNSKGAALAADSILARAGRESDYFSQDFSPGAEHLGDLYEMLYPALPPAERDIAGELPFSYQCLDDPANGSAMNIRTENPGKTGSLLCYRDSFGIALYPYLAESFGSAHFSRAAAYDLTAGDSDCIIIELVERNIDYLVEYAPRFPAPKRQLSGAVASDASVTVSIAAGGDGLSQFSGSIPQDMCDAGSRVYVSCGGAVYEACVLRGEGQESCFSAWMYTDAQPGAVLCCNNGVLTAYRAVLN